MKIKTLVKPALGISVEILYTIAIMLAAFLLCLLLTVFK